VNSKDIEEWVNGYGDEVLLADGFEDAFVGMTEIFNRPPLATYDRDKCIEILMERDGMSHDDAIDFFNYNVTGAWVGESTPAFVTFMKDMV
tara:strand:- start:84 stop:356 length:273 start_codon:yes stop_codon:yes gene_type:complete